MTIPGSKPRYALDQRSSPEFYVSELLDRFRAREGDAVEKDLAAFAEAFGGGQLEDGLIELLGLPPDDALDALLEWGTSSEASGTPRAMARRRIDTVRRLSLLAEREFTDSALIAFVTERHGGTLSQLLANAMQSNEPS